MTIETISGSFFLVNAVGSLNPLKQAKFRAPMASSYFCCPAVSVTKRRCAISARMIYPLVTSKQSGML
ncbi:hypothetical protein D3C71_2197380 [compost metagenome]